MFHRLRYAMDKKQPAKFKGIVEADETGAITYITKKKLPPDAASTTVTQNWQQYDLELLSASVQRDCKESPAARALTSAADHGFPVLGLVV